MRHMKKLYAMIASILVFVPGIVSAAAISKEEIALLESDALKREDSCKLIDIALNLHGDLPKNSAGMTSSPEWKTVTMKGVTIRVPWSPFWYLLGKQIPWMDAEGDSFAAGRYTNAGHACGLRREYSVSVLPSTTIAKHFSYSNPDGPVPEVLETFSLNGRKAALTRSGSGVSDYMGIVVEVMKNKATHIVWIQVDGESINNEMLRMAMSVK